MKKPLIILCLMLSMFFVSAKAEQAVDDDLFYISPDYPEVVLYKDLFYAVDVDRSLYEWESSNRAVVHVFSSGVFLAISTGESVLTGTPKDSSLDKIQITLYVPSLVYSTNKVVIDSPEGTRFQYKWQGGSVSMGFETKGDVFTYKSIPQENHDYPDELLFLPKKTGKGQFIIRTTQGYLSIDVEVVESAME